ncbi:unnamed protein product [Vitrella brassicaformis CCMP3155]|uniref:GST C-terminal domain-containing protein n=1 Tax=Vitrella brassicaformis (strain CCMP3155) TaxID=1169540 RepID=A0A0G4EFL2_VITBC|nr:unnamed protein product [Vitrella brassicaformis CCMP3155]|eukprot:CEL94291.1 unnamed protein product [Vitrella brassicaformis CCMP3155]
MCECHVVLCVCASWQTFSDPNGRFLGHGGDFSAIDVLLYPFVEALAGRRPKDPGVKAWLNRVGPTFSDPNGRFLGHGGDFSAIDVLLYPFVEALAGRRPKDPGVKAWLNRVGPVIE